ncbi:sugar transporter ERD6-like 6 [Lathyrus oleraceus]|uniref:sugar transporter ERD6-like 6 n=1 Tax=Pisum sativum TaxID=3888 RepID=UPI0021D14829|nr:sugar transporter ERD6-like 6 [Pisum sativum]
MINEKRKQRELDLGDPYRRLDHIPYPPSCHEKWNRACQRPYGSFTSESTREVDENIDVLVEQAKVCIFVPQDLDDILVEAIGTEEHVSRVCDLGRVVFMMPKLKSMGVLNHLILDQLNIYEKVLATILTLWLADKSGRRLLLIVSSSAMALSLLVVSISFYLKEYISPDSDLYATLSLVSVAGVVVMVIAFSLGLGAMPWIIMSELMC